MRITRFKSLSARQSSAKTLPERTEVILRKYKYTAVNIEKKKFTGSFFAEDEAHLRQQLAQQNLFLISCRPLSDASPSRFFSVTGKVDTAELTNFCRQFAILLNSGISILDSLSQLKMQSFSGYFKKIIYMVYDDVKIGVLLSKAMEKHKKVFPEFFRSMIYVGEISGNLELVLTNLADYYQKEEELDRKIKSALAYPIIMGVLLVAVVLLFLLFIIPQFENTIALMDIKEMNPITTAVFATSRWVRANGLYLLCAVVILIAVIFFALRTEKGKYATDVIKYRLPAIKRVQIDMVASKFTKATGLLLTSGMNLVDALDVVQNLLGNRYASKIFKNVIEDVRRGASLTFAMGCYNIFPQMLIQMISTGESSGELDEVLVRTQNYFDQQVEVSILKATSLIQPILLAVMGAVIALMFIAVYSPMLTIMQQDYTNTASVAKTVSGYVFAKIA